LIQSFFFAQIFEHKKTEPEFCLNYFLNSEYISTSDRIPSNML